MAADEIRNNLRAEALERCSPLVLLGVERCVARNDPAEVARPGCAQSVRTLGRDIGLCVNLDFDAVHSGDKTRLVGI
jgi:hypothetical protein